MSILAAAPAGVLRRIPFTLALAFTIVATASATGTLVRDIAPGDLAAWGFTADDLAAGSWFRLFLSMFRILDPSMVVTMTATVLAFVGACEARLGTVRAAAVYAVTHAAGTVSLVAMAMVLSASHDPWAAGVLAHPQVGASTGAYGALAAWLVFLPSFPRRVGVVACAVFLILSFARDVHPWDVSQAVAFLAGLAMGGAMLRHDARRGARADGAFTADDRRRTAAWLCVITGLVGFLVPFAIAQQVGMARMTAWLGLEGVNLVRYAFFAAGVALVTAARGVRRGERLSWQVALAASVVPAVGLWQSGAPGVEHVLAILLFAALITWRAEFALRAAVPSRAAAWRAALSVPAAAALYIAFGFLTLRAHFVPPLPRGEVIPLALLRLRFGSVAEPNWYSPRARWFLESLPLVVYGACAAAVAILAWRAWRNRSTLPS